MDIRINRVSDKKVAPQMEGARYDQIRVYEITGDLDAPYRLQVTTHGQGGHVAIPDEPGMVWVDKHGKAGRSTFDKNLNETHEAVPYSPWAIRGVVLANRPYNNPGEIRITTNHSASSYGQPVVLVDGEITDLHTEL